VAAILISTPKVSDTTQGDPSTVVYAHARTT